MKKNCMFQYATENKIYKDTDLISIDEALKMFNEHKDMFIAHLQVGLNPEMVLWVNCADSSSYGDHMHWWHADDFKVINGDLYQKAQP